MKTLSKLIAVALVVIVLPGVVSTARTDAAKITGYLRDNSGNPVANVGVTGDDFVGDTFPVKTDVDGFYEINLTAEGNYRVMPDCNRLSDLDFSCPGPGVVTITSDSAELNFTVFPVTRPLMITNITLPDGKAGTYYHAQLGAKGGHKPYRWQMAIGATNVPAGLALNSRGLISGLPTESGLAAIDVQVTDANSMATNQVIIITILPQTAAETSDLPVPGLQTNQSQSLQ